MGQYSILEEAYVKPLSRNLVSIVFSDIKKCQKSIYLLCAIQYYNK